MSRETSKNLVYVLFAFAAINFFFALMPLWFGRPMRLQYAGLGVLALVVAIVKTRRPREKTNDRT